jgi:hypothetical protein
MRSLKADRFRPSLVGLLLAMALLIAWAAWFFLSSITLYEVSETARLTEDGMVVAIFSPEKLGRVQRGQLALLRLDAAVGEPTRAIPAIVTDVTNQAQEDQVQVELYLLDGVALASLQEGLTGQVEVEVEHVSPATLVMRASGLFLDTPSLSLSPQDRPD